MSAECFHKLISIFNLLWTPWDSTTQHFVATVKALDLKANRHAGLTLDVTKFGFTSYIYTFSKRLPLLTISNYEGILVHFDLGSNRIAAWAVSHVLTHCVYSMLIIVNSNITDGEPLSWKSKSSPKHIWNRFFNRTYVFLDVLLFRISRPLRWKGSPEGKPGRKVL